MLTKTEAVQLVDLLTKAKATLAVRFDSEIRLDLVVIDSDDGHENSGDLLKALTELL